MSFFSKFFKAKQPETIHQRIESLGTYDQQQLLELIRANEPDALRQEAIRKLSDADNLLAVALDTNLGSGLSVMARRKVGELLDEGKLTVAQLTQRVQDHQQLLSLCGYSSQAGLELIEQLNDEDTVLTVAMNGSTSQLRQAASQRLQQRHHLETLFKHAKNKDKAVYKIVKTKLEVFKQEKAKQAELESTAQSLCNQAEQLSKCNLDDIFIARFDQLNTAWHELSDTVSEIAQKKFLNAQQKCQTKIDEYKLAEKQKQEAIQAEIAAKRELLDAIKGAHNLIAKILDQGCTEEIEAAWSDSLVQLSQALDETRNRGLNTEAESKAIDHIKTQGQQLKEKTSQYGSLTKLLERLQSQEVRDDDSDISAQTKALLDLSKFLPQPVQPHIVTDAKSKLDELRQQKKASAAAQKQKINEANELLRRGNWAVKQGHVGRARAILRDLTSHLDAMEQLPSHVESKFDDYKIAIDKLGDWHEFAVTPKKQQLVTEMQQLIGSPLSPKDLADKIQNLQNQWKELCKGGQNQDEEVWHNFREAAQEAYEPCKKYFEVQTQQREQNAGRRHTLIQQLNEYLKSYDWDSANWPEVEKTLKISREAWMSYWPIDRKAVKTLQGQFDSVMDALHGKLNSEHERNRSKKQGIVEQAAKLLDNTDTQFAIDEAKKLQQQWRNIGRCKRKDDQQLWNQFREHCDGIFARRQQENEHQMQERINNKQAAIAIIDQLEAMTALEEDAFFTAKSGMDELLDAYQNLGELPRDDARSINTRYQNALRKIEQHTDQVRTQAIKDNWLNIFDLSHKIAALECSETVDQSALEALDNAMQELNKWPGETQKALEVRIAALKSSTPREVQDCEKQLRQLCIKAEVANGLESPESDKTLRMEYQVTQLQSNFGQSNDINASNQKLVEEWLAVSGAQMPEHQALFDRFLTALKWN